MSFGRNIDWYRERVAVGGQVRYRYVRRFVDSTTGEDILLPTEWRRYDITSGEVARACGA